MKFVSYKEIQALGCTDSDTLYQLWIANNEPNMKELLAQKTKKFNYEPKISIVVPVWNTPPRFLLDMI
jgi:hypothetical protein